MENIKKLYEALATDEALKERAAKFKEENKDVAHDEVIAKIVEFAAAEGYSFTAEEYKAYAGSATPIKDDELDAVAGGCGGGGCGTYGFN